MLLSIILYLAIWLYADEKLSDLALRRRKTIILDLAHINLAYATMQLPLIDGVIGCDILKKYKASINFSTKKLVINI